MKFCGFCDNMMYIDLDENSKMNYFCKSCNNREEVDENTSICILDNNYIDDETNYQQYLNKHIKHDPTLPRVTNIECPNKKCSRSKNQHNEVIIIKYDFTNMKFLYCCEYCSKFWKSEKNEHKAQAT
jgi:hypothetical protein